MKTTVGSEPKFKVNTKVLVKETNSYIVFDPYWVGRITRVFKNQRKNPVYWVRALLPYSIPELTRCINEYNICPIPEDCTKDQIEALTKLL